MFLNVSETAELLNISERHLRNLIVERKIKHCRAGRAIRFHVSDILSYMFYKVPSYVKLTREEREDVMARREWLSNERFSSV